MPVEWIPLHPTFVAEARGVDFSKPVSREVADEIIRGVDKYGVVVFRSTGMSDEQHIQFTKHLGDLDDISGYIAPGAPVARRTRFLELFDASNMDSDGRVLQEHEKRFQYNKVFPTATKSDIRVTLYGT
jgi:alpha-ketoglutarate-dependent 2,4-dichlorophenoxyacetate dioxygenase